MATKRWHVKEVKRRDLQLLNSYKLEENEVLYLTSRDLQNKLNSKNVNEIDRQCILKFRKRERSKACQSNEMAALECNLQNLRRMKEKLQIEKYNLKKEKEMFSIKSFLENDSFNGGMPQNSTAEIDDVICSLGSVIESAVEK